MPLLSPLQLRLPLLLLLLLLQLLRLRRLRLLLPQRCEWTVKRFDEIR